MARPRNRIIHPDIPIEIFLHLPFVVNFAADPCGLAATLGRFRFKYQFLHTFLFLGFPIPSPV
jgi:hypothetical protein